MIGKFICIKLKRSIHLSWLALISVWAIPIVFLIRCIRPYYLIKFGTFNCFRIGHFAADTGQRFAENQSLNRNQIQLYWLPENTSNSFWASLVRRNFLVFSWVRYLDLWNKLIPGGRHHQILSSYTNSRDINGVLEKQNSPMLFTKEEDNLAHNWLKNLGWSENQPFVVLLSRDSKYLAHDRYLRSVSSLNPVDYSYHSYRDSDISTYVSAVEWLAEQGALVLRMGSMTNKRIPSTHNNVIDYSCRNDKTAFLDVWLFAHAFLCITTGTGPDMISDVYRRPLLALNYIPISRPFSWSNALHAPKHLAWRGSKTPLTLRESLENSWLKTHDYTSAGIDIRDLSSEDILAITQECWHRLHNEYHDEPGDTEKQFIFRQQLQKFSLNKYNSWLHPDFRISSVFLRNNPLYLHLY